MNGIDANREDIDDYLKELENMSDHALSLLSTLREVRLSIFLRHCNSCSQLTNLLRLLSISLL